MSQRRPKKKKGSDDEDDQDPSSDDYDFVPAKRQAPAPPPPAPLPVAPVLIEELWAQCDRCQKWRLLPPGTPQPPDNVPWFCTLNPDRLRNSCDAPEVAYNDNGLIEQPLPQPKKGKGGQKKGGALPKSQMSAVEERVYKKKNRGLLPALPEAGPAFSAVRAPLEPVPKAFSSPAEELEHLVKGCQRILANLGSWDAPRPHQPLVSLDLQLPTWMWAGLHHFAPAPTRAACYALDVFSASEYSEASASGGALGSNGGGWGAAAAHHHHQPLVVSPQERTMRMALMAAAAAALPQAEAAAAAAAAAPAAAADAAGPGPSSAGWQQLGGMAAALLNSHHTLQQQQQQQPWQQQSQIAQQAAAAAAAAAATAAALGGPLAASPWPQGRQQGGASAPNPHAHARPPQPPPAPHPGQPRPGLSPAGYGGGLPGYGPGTSGAGGPAGQPVLPAAVQAVAAAAAASLLQRQAQQWQQAQQQQQQGQGQGQQAHGRPWPQPQQQQQQSQHEATRLLNQAFVAQQAAQQQQQHGRPPPPPPPFGMAPLPGTGHVPPAFMAPSNGGSNPNFSAAMNYLQQQRK